MTMARVGAKPAPLARPVWSMILAAAVDLVILRARIGSALHEGVDIEEPRPGKIMIAWLDHAGRKIEVTIFARRCVQIEAGKARLLRRNPNPAGESFTGCRIGGAAQQINDMAFIATGDKGEFDILSLLMCHQQIGGE